MEETGTAVNSVAIPRFALVYGTEEHLIKSQCIGSVTLNNHIGIYNIEHALRHLLYCPAANVFAVFKNKLRILVFGSPVSESLCIENVIGNNINVNVNGRYIILIF